MRLFQPALHPLDAARSTSNPAFILLDLPTNSFSAPYGCNESSAPPVNLLRKNTILPHDQERYLTVLLGRKYNLSAIQKEQNYSAGKDD
jgi:hypothetical protein